MEGSELVVGLVGAVGADLDSVSKELAEILKSFGYSSAEIHLIELVHSFERWKDVPHSPEETRISRHMDAGNELRESLSRADALAMLGLLAIRRQRRQLNGTGDGDDPIPRFAYILRSLKTPEEVDLLREVYGSAFIVLSVYAPNDVRLDNLSRKIAASRNSARAPDFKAESEALEKRDQEEEQNSWGQNVRNTFAMGDAFLDARDQGTIRKSIGRFIYLLFGSPFLTPSRDEQAMSIASIASLRSADLSRQVGATLTTDKGELIAIGTNDVPRASGGQYWYEDADDQRDFQVGYDTGNRMKRLIVGELITELAKAGWLKASKAKSEFAALQTAALSILKHTQLMKAIEYGRAVHAEMGALLECARLGRSTVGTYLYTTTFPCHDCTRHIIAAGVIRVVYIEPYPKSLALTFHPDSVVVDPGIEVKGKVVFEPFVGVSPIIYRPIFSAGIRKDDDGRTVGWMPGEANPILQGTPPSYMTNEKRLIALFERFREDNDLTLVA